MTAGERAAKAARATIGSRFRLHGRDPATGLDCIGVALVAMRAGGFDGEVPDGYALRGGDPAAIAAIVARQGLVAVSDDAQPGDLLLCIASPAQLHFAVQVAGGFVHADAMLRRVVERPGAIPWIVLRRWRLAEGAAPPCDTARATTPVRQ